ncbi:hypothetical protein I4U23_028029 [Adineta vaga]|nr:hypothetical protein I4U23_028029 [Adineta vaga]
MRRTGTHNNGHPGGPSEFHLDIPQIPIWQNNSMPPPPPIHLQLLPTNINGHHTGLDHLMNNGGEQLDQSSYVHNFMYPSSAQTTPFNGNGTVYFTHPATPMATAPPPSSSQPSQTHFHQFHPSRTFENSNRHQYQHPSHFQSSPVFQATPPVPPSQVLTPSSSSSSSAAHLQQQDNSSMDIPPRFRRLKRSDQDNKYSQSRPMSGDFDHLRNSFSHFNNDNRYQSRPQSFYDFSAQQQSTNNFFRSSSNNNNNNLNNRYQRINNNNNNNNNTNSLPLSAYMNKDENSYWGTSTYQRRRSTQQQQQQRNYHQDKHQFPLSSYDPRQYGFNNNYSRRNDSNNRSNPNRRSNNTNINSNRIDDSNDIDLIEEWWEDDNPELIGTNQPQTNLDSQTTTTTIDDSGNSSLSTSMHLRESTLDDEDENNRSINDSVNAPSDTSITENNIIESLDKLQQQLKLEEAVEKQLASEHDQLSNEFLALDNETTTYDTAHFLQWAKEKFREELAGRLTAKEIAQHDAVTSDDDDENDDLVVTTGIKLEQYQMDQITDDDIDNHVDELEDDLNEKLTIEDKTSQAIVVE